MAKVIQLDEHRDIDLTKDPCSLCDDRLKCKEKHQGTCTKAEIWWNALASKIKKKILK